MTLGAIPLIPGASLLIHSQHLYSIGTISSIIHSYSTSQETEDHQPVKLLDVTPEDDKAKDDNDKSDKKHVGKKRMVTNHSISVVEIALETPLPFVHLSKFKSAVIAAQQLKTEHGLKKEEDKSLGNLTLDRYTGNVDRICIRRDDETVATGIVLDILDEQRYDFIV